MAWYNVGTVGVTNGSPTITGLGTSFIASVKAGYIFYGPDSKLYEVLSVISDVQITLQSNYLGDTALAEPYAVIPTQGAIPSLVVAVEKLITDYSNAIDTSGAGKFNSGSPNTPGITFVADQDSGAYLLAPGSWALVCGGASGLSLTPTTTSINYSGVVKLITESTGVEVLGTMRATEIEVDGHTIESITNRITALEA